MKSSGEILAGDLIPDRALKAHDRDEFDYSPIADRIADLCCKAEAPVNVALFGPWGSGKSSLCTLVGTSLHARPERIKLIRYDAWRYGGEGLRRNFIAHAARELRLPADDPSYAEFHRGLYENQRRVSLSVGRAWKAIRDGKLTPLLLLLTSLVLIGLLLSPAAALVAAGVSIFLVVLAAVIDTGKVEVEESKPSEDEEFSARFASLVSLATDDGEPPEGAAHRLRALWRQGVRELAETTGFYRLWLWWADEIPAMPLMPPRIDRLVFFIDELDRCSRVDIVETLKALRTFLDAERCVFVVAADRDVIEAALTEVEQTTPINEEMPHYTTAGAYLDKIFQHQIALPPLRSRSLAKFARETAVEAGGVWRELALLDGDKDGVTPTLDRILFTLIPSHVRSPRRIKVLLNGYATNVRMARSRLQEVWPERARELARLTAFQTEFPDFATDLSYEPRLPRYLLDGGAPDSEAVRALLDRWRLDPGVPDESVGTEERPDPDPFIASTPDAKDDSAWSEALQQAERRRRRELRRYLERTHDVEDLRRDLFYLQQPGLDVGLDDPELAELIEAEATDSPRRVVEALEGRSQTELEGAARLLASMVGGVLGPEQTGVMTCLMEAVTMLGDDAPGVAREVVGALRTYWAGNELGEEHLVGALRTALAARAYDRALVGRVLADERLWANSTRVAAVVQMTPELGNHELAALRSGLVTWLPREPLGLLAALAELHPAQKVRLMDSSEAFAALGDALDREAEGEESEESGMSGERLVDVLLRPSLEAGRDGGAVVELFTRRLFELRREPAYRYLAEHRERVLSCLEGPAEKADFLLNGWLSANPDEWGDWAGPLEPDDLGADLAEPAAMVVAEMVEAVPDLEPAATRHAIGLLGKLAPALKHVDGELAEQRLTPVVEEGLVQHEWWGEGEEAHRQLAVHEFVRGLEEAAPGAAPASRKLRTREALAPIADGHPIRTEVARGWRELGVDLDVGAYDRMVGAVDAAESATDAAAAPAFYAELVATHAALHRLDGDFHGGRTFVAAHLKRIRAAAGAGGAECRALSAEAAAACLDLDPSPAQMRSLLVYVGHRRFDHANDAVLSWARKSGRQQATDLIKRLMPEAVGHHWLPLLREADYQEAPVIRAVRMFLLEQRDTSIEQRARMANSLEALGLRTRSGHDEVVGLIVATLKPKRPQNDLKVALALCRCLGAEHGGATRIEKALIAYARRYKHDFTPEENRAILSVGVQLPKSYLSKGARAKLGGMVGDLLGKTPFARSP